MGESETWLHVDVFSLSNRIFNVLVNDYLNKIFLFRGQAEDLRSALSMGAMTSICITADHPYVRERFNIRQSTMLVTPLQYLL